MAVLLIWKRLNLVFLWSCSKARELQILIERGVPIVPNGGLIEIDLLFAGGAPPASE
jgi:hypothetical protein